jgi:hypothetical protein
LRETRAWHHCRRDGLSGAVVQVSTDQVQSFGFRKVTYTLSLGRSFTWNASAELSTASARSGVGKCFGVEVRHDDGSFAVNELLVCGSGC